MEKLTTEQMERKDQVFQDHRIKKLEEKIDTITEYVEKHLRLVVNRLYEEVQTLKSQQQIPSSDSGIFKVKSIFFNKEYEYKDKIFSRYIVELEGFPSPFIMDRKAKNMVNPEVGGNIFCKIDGDKLRDVEVIHTLSN